MQICEIRLAACEIGFACDIFSLKMLMQNGLPRQSILYLNNHEVTQQHALGHISHFRRKYTTFPTGKISLGDAKIPFRIALLPVIFP
jgi:hypothetical protein